MCSLIPNRPRIGPVSRPIRVVAPISVNGWRSERHRRARASRVERDVDLEVLHRRVEVLLDDGRQAVDLVDEQHVAAARAS